MSSNVSEVKNEIKIDLAKANVQDSVSIVIVHKDKPEYLNIALQSIAVNSFWLLENAQRQVVLTWTQPWGVSG